MRFPLRRWNKSINFLIAFDKYFFGDRCKLQPAAAAGSAGYRNPPTRRAERERRGRTFELIFDFSFSEQTETCIMRLN